MSAQASREGDWDCALCQNKNYAFRMLCNRCKQPRVWVEKSVLNTKDQFRPGDWICRGCGNRNYAFRAKCNKCSQAKEIPVMPGSGGLLGMISNMPVLPGMSGMTSSATLGLNSAYSLPFLLAGSGNFRIGDWICSCGFHNYSSRTTCKKCNSERPPPNMSSSLIEAGMKRPATEVLEDDGVGKRQNIGVEDMTSGDVSTLPQNLEIGYWDPQVAQQQQWLSHMSTASGSQYMMSVAGMPLSAFTLGAAGLSLGAKGPIWREGDWICAGCNNHNYASRAVCNRCGHQKMQTDQAAVTAAAIAAAQAAAAAAAVDKVITT